MGDAAVRGKRGDVDRRCPGAMDATEGEEGNRMRPARGEAA
jgi:hypothetical protein